MNRETNIQQTKKEIEELQNKLQLISSYLVSALQSTSTLSEKLEQLEKRKELLEVENQRIKIDSARPRSRPRAKTFRGVSIE